MHARNCIFCFSIMLAIGPVLRADESPADGQPTETVTLLDPAVGTTQDAPVMAPTQPEFSVKNTLVQPLEASKDSGVPGIPPVTATVRATVQLVDDPGLTDSPPPPLPPLDVNDPAVQARLTELRSKMNTVARPEIAFVSATWFIQEQVSKISWWVDGEQMTCFSRLNFLHFSGVGKFAVGARQYELIMGIGSEDTGRLRELIQSKGREFQAPEIPAIADGQDFVVTQGDSNDAAKMQLLLDLVNVGKTKAQELEAAYTAREQARLQREAYLRANPPQPQDVVIRVWKRNQPASAQGGQTEGGSR